MATRSHRAIIGLWPSPIEFAKSVGVSASNARMMMMRGIPPKHFNRVIEAMERCGFRPATYAELSAGHKQIKEQRLAQKIEN